MLKNCAASGDSPVQSACGEGPQGRRRSSLALLTALLSGLLLLPEQNSPAQGGRPGSARPAARPAAPGAAGKSATPQAAAPETAEPVEAAPPGFVPPGEPPEVMTLEKELLTKTEAEALRREIGGGFTTMLRQGNLNGQTRAQMQKLARYYVHRLSVKDYRDKLKDYRSELRRLINDAASLQSNAQTTRKFREYFLGEIAARATELLDGNFQVRLAAVLILSDLNIVEADPRRNVSAEAYTPTLEPLLNVLTDENQPDAVKIPAANGVARVTAAGRPDAAQKITVADVLIAELQRPGANPWYQRRLAESLGQIDQSLDRFNRPFVAQALAKVVADSSRPCGVRAEAAKALGRIPLEAQVNVANLAFGVAQMTREVAEQYNKSPGDAHWRDCFWTIYLAFQPADRAEKQRGAGLLARVDRPQHAAHKAKVVDAYQQLLPLIRHVVLSEGAPRPLPAEQTNAMSEWLKKNQPNDYRVAPNLQPLSSQQASTPDPKPAG